MSSITVDLRVPPGLPGPEVADFIERAEDAGFDGVGIPDRQQSGRDVYVLLSAAALRTSRVTLYPAVTNPLTRHPAVLASLAQSLEELAPERTRMVIGSGDTSAQHIGVPAASVAQMRSSVTAVRKLLAGESVPFGNSPEERLEHICSSPPPVYVTASGPRMVELAGEVGDGALLMVGTHPRMIAEARQRLQKGAQRAGRELSNYRVIFAMTVVIDKDLSTARERARRQCFLWITYGWRAHWLKELGFQLPEVKRPEDIPAELLGSICDAIGLVGPAGYCLERLQGIVHESGIDHIFCSGSGGYEMPQDVVDGFQQVILPRVK